MQKKVSAISTACKNCIFAIYDGNRQVDCRLGRTQKIADHDYYELLEVYDNDKEFYVLNNHLCPYQRVEGWIYSKDDDAIDKVKNEVYIPWVAILVINEDLTYNEVKSKIMQLLGQTNPPKIVTIINYASMSNFNSLFNLFDDPEITCILKLHNVLITDLGLLMHIDSVIDKIKHNKFVFYAVLLSNHDIPEDLYDGVHKFVLDNINQFSVIYDSNTEHGMIVNKTAHIKYTGNSNGSSLIDKIKTIEKDRGLLVDYEKVYQRNTS